MKSLKFEKEKIQSVWALTPLQEGMLYHYRRDPGSVQYFEQCCLELSGSIDPVLFESAWNSVVAGNEMLRVSFVWENTGQPVQVVRKEHKVDFKIVDLSDIPDNRKEQTLDEYKSADRLKGLNLSEVPFRLSLCKFDDRRYYLIVSNHHILYDGWSTSILLKESFVVYTALLTGTPLPLKKKNSFETYIKWLQKKDKEAQRNYWSTYLSDPDARSTFHIRQSPQKSNRLYKEIDVEVDESIWREWEGFCSLSNITLGTLLYCGLGFLLQCYNNSPSIVLGTTVAGRPPSLGDVNEIVGLFINTVPLLVNGNVDETVEVFLSGMHRSILERDQFIDAPLTDIRAHCGLGASEDLFNTIISIENYPLDTNLAPPQSKLRINSYSFRERTNYDLAVNIWYFDGTMRIRFVYDADALPADVVESLASRFERVILSFCRFPQQCLADVSLLPEEEKEALLSSLTGPASISCQSSTLHRLFCERAVGTPMNSALLFKDQCLTYGFLNETSNGVATALRKRGVRRDSLVGIFLDRSVDMVVALLGILKAGGGYVPIDLEYPDARRQFIMEDAGLSVLLTHRWFLEELKRLPWSMNGEGELLLMNDGFCDSSDADVLGGGGEPGSLAYVIYTSGSTGRPKGVMVEHRQAVALAYSQRARFDIDVSDRVLLFSSLCFDASVEQIFIAFCGGAGLVVVDKQTITNIDSFCRYLRIQNITHLHAVPSFLMNVPSIGGSMRRVVAGGEICPVALAQKWAGVCRFYNEYGPTETTVTSIELQAHSDTLHMKRLPIGTPLPGTRVYILDFRGQQVPPGAVGEIFIGGAGVTRGYLNLPQLTAENFIADYLDSRRAMYRTGDLGRVLPDGNIDYLGRVDNQIKVRGYRIEIGEIEHVLTLYPGINEALAAKTSIGSGDPFICAYFVGQSGETSREEHDIRQFLEGRLPSYMIPARFVQLDSIPRLPSGKVDYRSLPQPRFKESRTKRCFPRNEIEKALARIWADILGLDEMDICIDDDFFSLGGHSLTVTRMTALVYQRLGIKIDLSCVFEEPSIRSLASLMAESRIVKMPPIPDAEEKEYYPLSPAQRRLFVANRMDPVSTAYNIAGVFELEGSVDIPWLERCFRSLVQRHEGLRTSFPIVENEPVQRIHPEARFELELLGGTIDTNGSNIDVASVFRDFVRPFRLDRPPLFRAGVLQSEASHCFLVVDMHHIIADGASTAILLKEFIDTFRGAELSAPLLRYRDYAVWIKKEIHEDRFASQREYWLRCFEDPMPPLNLPVVAKGDNDVIAKSRLYRLSSKKKGIVENLMKETGTTLFMVMMSLFAILLSKMTNREDLVVGAPVEGRRRKELEPILGIFINMLPIRMRPAADISFKAFLKGVKSLSLQAFENQDYPFEVLVENLGEGMGARQYPLFEAMLVMQSLESRQLDISGLNVSFRELQGKHPKLPLTLAVEEENDCINLFFRGDSRFFTEESLGAMGRYLCNILALTERNLDVPISSLELLSKIEKQKILEEFNSTARRYPRQKTVCDFLIDQVDRHPGKIAVNDGSGNGQLTFATFYRNICRLAEELSEKGVGVGDLVAVKTEPDLSLPIFLFGILLAGAAFLPVDPNFPRQRIEFMLRDSSIRILLGGGDEDIDCCGGVQQLRWNHAANPAVEPFFPGTFPEPGDPVYCIYTSGTTGKPKGVVLRHGNLANYCGWAIDYCDLSSADSGVLTSSAAFDLGYTSIFPCLSVGACLHIIPRSVFQSAEALLDYIGTRSVSYIKLTPSLFAALSESPRFVVSNLSYLRLVLLGGEAIRIEPIRQAHRISPGVLFVNHYGPTETTIGSIACRIDFSALGEYALSPSIGTPIANTKVAIVDRFNHVVPPGFSGEICIAGEGVAEGYLNRPDLTGERFVKSPFSEYPSMYRTGDLGRWDSDGVIEFIGRADQQTKIRGYRVELGEIEHALLACAGVDGAVAALVMDPNGETSICAYIVADDLDVQALIRELRKKIPDYMIPTAFVSLEKIPLTPNGKVDRQSLPAPDFSENKPVVPPRNAFELELRTLWSHVLGISEENIGIETNFFNIGGHSLAAVHLSSQIHRQYQVQVSLPVFFRDPTIEGLAKAITSSDNMVCDRILKAEKRDFFPLSPAQMRVYISSSLVVDSVAYNMPVALELTGDLDVHRLEETFNALALRHRCLRIRFYQWRGRPVQRVLERPDFEFRFECFKKDGIDLDSKITEFIRPFDLHLGPLFRVSLLEFSKTEHLLLLDMHHIIADGASRGILIKDFVSFYTGEKLPELPIHYGDYVLWQSERDSIDVQRNYWLKEFEVEPQAIELPLDFPRTSMPSFPCDSITFSMGCDLLKSIRMLASSRGGTLYMAVFSIFYVLLWKLSGQEDLIVGTASEGRRHVNLQKLVGMFVNTLVMRHNVTGDKLFGDFLHEVKMKALAGFDNQDYPFEELVGDVLVNRAEGRNPLFDVMFVMDNVRLSSLEMQGMTIRRYPLGNQSAKFDLALIGSEQEDTLDLLLEYRSDLFKRQTIRRFASYFTRIAECVANAPHVRLEDIDIMSADERRNVLFHFNNTSVDIPRRLTLSGLVEQAAADFPDSTALIYSAHQLTYDLVWANVCRLRSKLQGKGAGRGMVVPLLLERSPEMVVGMAAVMASGAAYLPIDPHSPQERIRFFVEDCDARLLVGKFSEDAGIADISSELELVEAGLGDVRIEGGDDETFTPSPLDCAYVIYTSGSTGRPKGVMIEHRSAVNVVTWFKNQYRLDAGSRVLLLTSYTFDASVNQIFGTISANGSLIIVDRFLAVDYLKLREYIDIQQIHVINFVPQFLKELLGQGPVLASVNTVISGGEPLTATTKDLILQNGYKLFNQYGPTETTIDATMDECGDRKPSLGKPISNARCYILDKYLKPVPVGVTGELYIAGTGLARGYLNKPRLTAESFVTSSLDPGGRLYKTGDRAKWLEDGRVDFLGRSDQQVKIRGYRIELREIEHSLLSHDQVSQAVVICRGEEAENYLLYAYVVMSADFGPGDVERVLYEYMAGIVPGYMIPSFFVRLEEIPVTTTGKIDRSSLPLVDKPVADADPLSWTAVALRLKGLWADILGIEEKQIGVQDNFFESGGHSLKAVMLVSHIQKHFDVRLPLAEIFRNPHLSGLAKCIESKGIEEFSDIVPMEKRDYYAVSPAQKRIFILHQMESGNVHYNIAGVFPIDISIGVERVEDAFQTLVKRHEGLRTSFVLHHDHPVQRVREQIDFTIPTYRLREKEYPHWWPAGAPEDSLDIPGMVGAFVRPFDLDEPPLFRVELLVVDDSNCFLLIDLHHIITDATSMELLRKEFTDLCAGASIPPIKLNYRDYACWLTNARVKENYRRQEEFWLRQFSGEIPSLELPFDAPRPRVFDFAGKSVGFELNRHEIANLKMIAVQCQCTMFMVLAAVLNVLLGRLSGQDDIVIGIPVAGRRHADLENVLGVFVNTLAFRNFPCEMKTLRDFILEVKERALLVFDHQDYPFEELVEKINVPRDTGRNPLFDVLFNFLGSEQSIGDRYEENDSESRFHTDSKAKFDLSVTIRQVESRVNVYFRYKTLLFAEKTIEAFISYFRKIISTLPKNLSVPIGRIPLVAEGEELRIVKTSRTVSQPSKESEPGPQEMFTAPRDRIEKKLAESWAEILGIHVEGVSIDHDFFRHGGHSLKAIQMLARIQRDFSLKISLKDFFGGSTIRWLAEYIISAGMHEEADRVTALHGDCFPLTSAQKRMFVLHQLEPERCGYNIPIINIMEGEPDLEKIEVAFQSLIDRHESLRTSFQMKDGMPVQRIHKSVDFQLEFFNRKDGIDSLSSHEIDRLIKMFVRPFDISIAPLLRVGIVVLGKKQTILMVDLHHIVSDGTSLVILINDFGAIYSGVKLSPLRLQYKDYTGWLQRPEVNESIGRDKRYWISQYEDHLESLDLSADFPRPQVLGMGGRTLKFDVARDLTSALVRVAETFSTTLYTVLLAGLKILLARMSGQEDIAVGCPIAGRLHADFEGVVGMFVNTLAIRSFPSHGKTIDAYIEEIKEIAIQAFEHQLYQFEELVDALDIPRDTARNPIFDVMFVFQNMRQTTLELPKVKLIPYEYDTKIAKFDLNLIGKEMDGQLLFTLEYRTDLFMDETVRYFIKCFKRILSAFVHQPDNTVHGIELMNSDEKKRLLEMCLGAEEPLDEEVAIHRMFETCEAANPYRVALAYHNEAMCYRELNLRADRLAATFSLKGIARGSVVGIMANRSFEMIVGILAIMKAGGVVLPLDPLYPEERIRFMIEDSGTACVLVGGNRRKAPLPGERSVDLIDLANPLSYSSLDNSTQCCVSGKDSMYLIYTSGSTGKPKGVLLEHRNLLNLIVFQLNHTSIDFSRVMQFATISFDVSFQEIFSTLSCGGRLYIIDADTRYQLSDLFSTITRNDILTLFLPVAFLRFLFGQKKFAADFPLNVRHIVAAGEQLTINDLLRDHLKRNGVFLHNHYGPSETHVVTTFTIDPQYDIPQLPFIGTPVSNSRIYIFNREGRLQPPGVPGELCVGGIPVGRGYCNRPSLTDDCFTIEPDSGDRIYRTGDIARVRRDGCIEFMGRKDQQIKIRGFRVEPGEIECLLVREENVESAIVSPVDDGSGNNRLAAYIVKDVNCECEISDLTAMLRDSLSRQLPDYMVPDYFAILDHIPLTPSGKIDRSRLPEPKISENQSLSPPRNALDKVLAGIWSDVLEVEPGMFGIDSNFFSLGGHSLKAIALVSCIFQQVHKKVPLIEVFGNPTIRQLSDFIATLPGVAHTSVNAVEKMDYYPVSNAQKRMYILQRMQPESTAYNLPAVLVLEGEVDTPRLEMVFKTILRRHEILRTCFLMKENRVVQRVKKGEDFSLEIYDCRDSEAKDTSVSEITKAFVRPFDLESSLQLRVGLIIAGEHEYIFMADMHHIASDAVSIQILVRELTHLYGGLELPELNIQYRDFAMWEHRLTTGGEIERQEEFWLNKFSGDIPILELPLDFARGSGGASRRGSESFRINETVTGKLKEIALRERTTLFMIILSVYYVFLAKMCRQEDIVVGTVVSGRRHADLETIIGMFVNTLALRNYPSGKKVFIPFLREVMRRVLEAFDNQDYQFENLVETVAGDRESGRNPLFDTMFSFASLDRSPPPKENESPAQKRTPLKIRPYQREGVSQAKFDLLVTGVDEGNFISMSIGYNTGLFKEETIKRFAGYIEKIASIVAENPFVMLCDIEIAHELFTAKSEVYDGAASEFEF